MRPGAGDFHFSQTSLQVYDDYKRRLSYTPQPTGLRFEAVALASLETSPGRRPSSTISEHAEAVPSGGTRTSTWLIPEPPLQVVWKYSTSSRRPGDPSKSARAGRSVNLTAVYRLRSTSPCWSRP